MTTRALQEMYKNPAEAGRLGFWGKVRNSFKYETTIGETIRDAAAPKWLVDPHFRVTDDLLETYASDLPEEIQSRLAEESVSFAQFLHELDDVRIGYNQRRMYLQGAPLDKLLGMVAMMAGPVTEAVGATAAVGFLGTLFSAPEVGPAAPVVGVAAATATAAARVSRIRSLVNAATAAVKSTRGRAMLKGAGYVTAVDIPLELTRYEKDLSLTKTDLLYAIAGAATFGTALAAWKPHLFHKKAREMVGDAGREEAAAAARASGIPEDIVNNIEPPTPRARIVTEDEILDEVQALKGTALREEGIRLKIKNARRMPADDLRLEIAHKRRAAAPGVEAAVAQVTRDLKGITDLPTLRKRARDVGAKHASNARAATIKKAIIKTVKQQAASGEVVVRKKVVIPKHLQTGRTRININDIPHHIDFSTSVGRSLWRLGGNRSFKGRDELIDILKEFGIDDPMALGRELRRVANSKLEGIEAVKSRTIRIDEEDLLGKKFIPRTKERFVMEVDEDILTEASRTRTRRGLDPEGEEPHPVADAIEDAIIIDGEEVARGPIGARIIDLSADDLAEDAGMGGARLAGESGIGTAETSARFVEGSSHWYKKAPKILGIRSIAEILHNILTPCAIRLRSMTGRTVEDTTLLHKATDIFMESSRGGGKNLQTILRVNHQNLMNELSGGLYAAKMAAKKAGRTLSDKAIIRALTREIKGELAKPEAIAVKALQRFHGKLLKYAQKHGLMEGVITDSSRYFHRVWKNTTFSEFAPVRADMEEFFTNAIKSSSRNLDGVSDQAASEAARRIVQYGLDPVAARSTRHARIWVDGIRNDLKLKQKSLNLTDDDVQDVIDAVVGHVGNEPHLNGFAKRRIELDENFIGRIGGREVHIDEFMTRDIMGITQSYAHRVLGAVEMRKGMQSVFGENLDFESALVRLRNSVSNTEDQFYVRNSFELAFRRLSGQPLWTGGEALSSPQGMKFVLGMQSLAQGTMGMNLGIAQLPEMANIMLRTGARNAVAALPGLRQTTNTFLMMFRKEAGVRGSDGRLLDKVAAELETFCGVGGEYLSHEHVLRRLDDMGMDDGLGATGFGRFLDKGREISMLNPLGIVPMDTFLRRWATKAHFQNFVNQAYKIKNGKPALVDSFWRKDKFRFKELGLSDAELDRVFTALADPNVVSVRQGLFGNYKVMDVDFTKVKDQGAYDRLALAMRRGVDNAVQRQSMGEIPLWMSASPLAKLMTQYRVFSVASKGKQLAAGLARADAAEAINVVGSIGLGYLGYTALTYGRALGQSPRYRENYLAGRLTWEEGLKSGIMRCSYSAVFPMLIDSAMAPFTGQVFSPSGRTTHQGVGIIEGTVPWSLYQGIQKFGSAGLGAMWDERELSKKDYRDAMRLVWLTQIPGVNQIANYFVSESNLKETGRRR